MPGLVLDTHTALWYLELNPRLSATALGAIRQTLAQGERFLEASISLGHSVGLERCSRAIEQCADAVS